MAFFLFDKYAYDVDMMFAYINIFKPKYVEKPFGYFSRVIGSKSWGATKTSAGYSPAEVLANPKKYKYDYDKIKTADLSYPVIEYDGVLVDGTHRVTKSMLLKKQTIKVYVFSKALLDKFKITTTANYFNNKIPQFYTSIEQFYKNFCTNSKKGGMLTSTKSKSNYIKVGKVVQR